MLSRRVILLLVVVFLFSSNPDTANGQQTNQAPVALDDAYTTTRDTVLSAPANEGVLLNDNDPDGDSIVVDAFTNPSNGSLEIFADGAFSYTPNTGFTGTDTFTYHITDGTSDSNIATVSITVTESSSEPESLLLLTPSGVLAQTGGNPTYTWSHLGANTYQLYVARANDINARQLWEQNISAATFCSLDTCAIDPTQVSGAGWLVNGSYQVWLYSEITGWVRSPDFTVSVNVPGIVSLQPTSETGMLIPLTRWTINGSAANASWFRVYMAPSANLTAPIINQWFYRGEVCGSPSGTSCALRMPELQSGVEYSLYIRSWSPGGISVGGLNGWAGPEKFTPGRP